MASAITIRNLGKRYRLGGQVMFERTFGEMLADTAATLTGRLRGQRTSRASTSSAFWALRDLSLDVEAGEVLGVVGANGAGKSTLLKILSNICEPTEGYVRINGRVGSLLEVGTGFHPELTGRENIFLNGAILGMRRREVKRNFDAIVDFSGVEKFLDTPVKRYSSGMRLRLAFAVAAHLDPEILLIDEVLAVGDAEFQRKCLGKMQDVARGQGRTVLFVSHNMAAVQALCSRCILLEHGRVTTTGSPETVINAYYGSNHSAPAIRLAQTTSRRGSGAVRFADLQWSSGAAAGASELVSGRDATFELALDVPRDDARRVEVAIAFCDQMGLPLFTCSTRHSGCTFRSLTGRRQVCCRIPNLPLAPGQYRLHLWASVDGVKADHVESAAVVTVVAGDVFGTGKLPIAHKHGPLIVGHEWSMSDAPDATPHLERSAA